MTTEQISRLLQNLIRLGTVIDVAYGSPARVRIAAGGLETNWLPWQERRAGRTTTWNPPTIGEQVILLAPGGDLTGAVVLTGIHSDVIPPPSASPNETVTQYPDGAIAKYDHAQGAMSISGIKTLLIQASDSVTIQTPRITLDADQTTSTGKHTVEGLLAYLAGMSGENGPGGSTSITGSITHQGGDLSSNGIVVHLHVHDGVQSGGGTTGEPK